MTSDSPAFIYFDLGNVLLKFDHQRACRQVGELVKRPAAEIWDLLFTSELQARYEAGAITSGEMHEEFCRASATRSDYEAFHQANSQIFEINVPVIPIVAQLMAAGYRLGILSNTCEKHWEHVSGGRFRVIREFFSVHVLSHLVRSSKPDRGIYLEAVRCAGVTPESIFFLDDRPENVHGACQAGMDAVLYRGPRQLAADLRGRGVRFNY